MAIDASIVNFGQSTPTANALAGFGNSVAGAIQANKQSGLAENRKLAAGYLAQAFSDDSDEEATRALIEQAKQADPEFTLATIQRVSGGTNNGLTSSQRDFAEYNKLLESDPEKAALFGKQAGFIRETTQEKSDIKIGESIQKEIDKSNVKRVQGFVDAGIDAADAVGNIQRSIDLLDTVETGGFDNASLQAKKFFGVESADEAELSANLGKNVLAQLKPIFGAAFTAAEGQRLEGIEARFGSSTEGNKRLLSQALKITERAARRGLAAARKQGDDFTADEIEKSLASIQEIQRSDAVSDTTTNSDTAEVYQAPQAALDFLKANPDKANEFKEQFGYLPEDQ